MIPGETILSQKLLGMETDPHVSEFKVMHSGGGWYIGTVFLACGEKDCKSCEEYSFGETLTAGKELSPNSRETDYFGKKQEAEKALETYKKTGNLPNQRY